VALAVADIQETRKELDRLKVDYWVAESVVGPQSLQIFVKDPFNNIIELHPDRHLPLRDRATRRGAGQDGVSIVETAARLARERLAPRAAEYDRDAKNPVDSWRDLCATVSSARPFPARTAGWAWTCRATSAWCACSRAVARARP